MQPTHDLLSGPVRRRSLELPNRHLAAAIDFRGQIKHACWNVRGLGSAAACGPLDRVSVAIEHYADLIACQVAELGGSANGTIAAAVTRSFLPAYPLGPADAGHHARAVARALVAFGESLRQASVRAAHSGDAGTAALLTEIARGLDRPITVIERLTMPERRAARPAPYPTAPPGASPGPIAPRDGAYGVPAPWPAEYYWPSPAAATQGSVLGTHDPIPAPPAGMRLETDA